MRLLERLAAVGARCRLSPRTVQVYQAWVRQFLRYYRDEDRWREPGELRGPEVSAFLTHLAHQRRLSASSQNQAFCAILFLYQKVLIDELGEAHLGRISAARAGRPVRVPTVLSCGEVARLIEAMAAGSMHRLMVELMYGTGMRLMECCTLRVRDIDFDRAQIIVRQAKAVERGHPGSVSTLCKSNILASGVSGNRSVFRAIPSDHRTGSSPRLASARGSRQSRTSRISC